MLLLANQGRKHNAPFVHPREPGLPPEVGAGRLAAVDQPQDRSGNRSEDLRAPVGEGHDEEGARFVGRGVSARDCRRRLV